MSTNISIPSKPIVLNNTTLPDNAQELLAHLRHKKTHLIFGPPDNQSHPVSGWYTKDGVTTVSSSNREAFGFVEPLMKQHFELEIMRTDAGDWGLKIPLDKGWWKDRPTLNTILPLNGIGWHSVTLYLSLLGDANDLELKIAGEPNVEAQSVVVRAVGGTPITVTSRYFLGDLTNIVLEAMETREEAVLLLWRLECDGTELI